MMRIPLIKTRPHSCGYLPNHSAQSCFVSPALPMTAGIYGKLIAHGFRRSGDEVYKPDCFACSKCIPTRLQSQYFKPNRSQKRCLQKHQNTQVLIKPPVFEAAHYDLYQRYQLSRHGDGEMARCTPEEYLDFLASRWCETQFVEFTIDGQLAAVAVVDCLENALSAVYTFYEPDLARYSLGTYAVLWQIQQAVLQNLEFVYLGFWVADCQKMAYKSQFQPLQKFEQHDWR